MLVTLSGIVTLVRLVQSKNAWSPMLVTLSGIVTLVRLAHDERIPPMLVTLLGSVGFRLWPPDSMSMAGSWRTRPHPRCYSE